MNFLISFFLGGGEVEAFWLLFSFQGEQQEGENKPLEVWFFLKKIAAK